MFSDLLAQMEPEQSAAARQWSILIVDDDQSQVDVLAACLQKQGFSTAAAFEGRMGLAWACQNHPDLIILDLRLPDVNGLDVCAQLADSPETCDIPVLIVTGTDQDDLVRRCRAAGCTYFLRKPYDPNTLLTLIHTALKRDLDSWT